MVEITVPTEERISNEILVNGKRVRVDGTVNLKFHVLDDENATPLPDPDPDPEIEKPTEGTIKEGGWGGNTDPNSWHITNMRNPSDEFKIVDDKGTNVATNFKNMQTAQNFILYFKDPDHKFPPEKEDEEKEPSEGTDSGTGSGSGGNNTPADGGDVVVGKGTDKHGSQLLESDGKDIEYAIKDNLRDDGSRFDGNVGKWEQSEATCYFKFTGELVDDEVSIKWSETNHSGKNEVQCYDSGVSIQDGKARLRFENPHPTYSNNLGSGKGEPMKVGKWFGYKGIKTVKGKESVTIQLYQSTGDNEEKPSNDWKKIFEYTDTKYKRTGAHPYVTFRIDDPNKEWHKRDGKSNLERKWLSVARIT